jgi:hypothetical protein
VKRALSILADSPRTLIRTKQTLRPSDAADCRYLEDLLRRRETR